MEENNIYKIHKNVKNCGLDKVIEPIIELNARTEQTLSGLKLLNNILINIIANPSVQKFKCLKKDNKKLKEVLFQILNLTPFLKAIGFQEFEDRFEIMEYNKEYENLVRISQNYFYLKIQTYEIIEDAEASEEYAKAYEQHQNKFQEEMEISKRLTQEFEQIKKDNNEEKKEIVKSYGKNEKRVEYLKEKEKQKDMDLLKKIIIGFVGLIIFINFVLIPSRGSR